jgi:hypothetical protein
MNSGKGFLRNSIQEMQAKYNEIPAENALGQAGSTSA